MAIKTVKEEVIREFPPVGKYRVRVVKGSLGVSVDVREYVSSETFEGFTRRGIRIMTKGEAEILRDILGDIIETRDLK